MIPTVDQASHLRRGVVEACTLGLLSQKPMYGWEISTQLVNEGAIIASIGTLYPVLTRLRQRGLVLSYETPSKEGPPRRYYELTQPGKEVLASFRTDWARFAASVDRFINSEETK